MRKVVQALTRASQLSAQKGALHMALTPRIKIAAMATVGIAALTLTTAAAAAPAATTPPPVKSGASYLALGDSIPFGYRESNAVVAPDYTKPSTMAGYPTMVAKDLGLKLTDAACPGETTASFIKKGDQDNGCTLAADDTTGGYRSHFPLHQDYPRSQLLYALGYLKAHPNTKLVTLQVGANDGLRCRALHGGVCQGNDLAAVIQEIQTNLTKILTQLTTKGGYHGQIVLVNYYSINVRDPSGTGQVKALNQVEAGVAQQFKNVRVANAFGQFAQASKNSPDPSGTADTCLAGLETFLTNPAPGGNENCGIHPSRAGQALIATAVDSVVRKS